MVLISEQWRKRDQDKPGNDCDPDQSARIAKVNIQQHYLQRCVERWEKSGRRGHSAKPIEDRTEPAVCMQSRKREPQREKQKANTGNNDRGHNSIFDWFRGMDAPYNL